MDKKEIKLKKAYKDDLFLNSSQARPIRILSELIEPQTRLQEHDISDVIVFFGSARTPSMDEATSDLNAVKQDGGDVVRAERNLSMSKYYEDARSLANRLTAWSKELENTDRRFLICSGGGPGIMEAANRGASEAHGLNVGFNISLPFEQHHNPYITRELNFEFHYFFMRKFWFMYLAKALVVFPGGFGTLDELFEALTLIQTSKLEKKLPVVLYGKSFWQDVLNLDALVKYGTISPEDLDLFFETDTVDEAFDFIVGELTEHSLHRPGASL